MWLNENIKGSNAVGHLHIGTPHFLNIYLSYCWVPSVGTLCVCVSVCLSLFLILSITHIWPLHSHIVSWGHLE